MLYHVKKFIPGYGIKDHPDQYPMCIYTILSVNETVGDCAAYEAVGHTNADGDMIERMKGGGNKISEADARQLFPEIEEQGLRYRL